MEEFSVFKSKEKSKKCDDHHSLFVPHIPLFDSKTTHFKRNSVADLVSLNERYYDTNKNISAAASEASALSSEAFIFAQTKKNQTLRAHRSKIKDDSAYKKYDAPPVQFKRRRIKDIDLRFANTGIMPYCDYLRGIK